VEKKLSPRTLLAWMLLLWTCLAQVWAQAAPPAPAGGQRLRIVGGLAGIHQYVRNEEPFWTQELSRLTAGKYSAEIAPFDRSGVPGEEMLRLMELGVVPFGTALMNLSSAQNPMLGAIDLAGLNPDIASLRRNLTAYRPYLQKMLREKHGVELLAVYIYPAQVLFCKRQFSSLLDLEGRRIRVSSPTQSDMVAALGGVPVLVGFSQIVANMQSGNTECAITGTMSGYTIGLHEVTEYYHPMPISWGLALFGANLNAWNALPADLRAVLGREIPKLEANIWAESERETAEGLACNRGDASCTGTRKGSMKEVAPSKKDAQRMQEILRTVVIPRWMQRCNQRCKDMWDNTIGSVWSAVPPSTAAR
jgi:TRAP-type C4-dicarboxylate transport system substrate-binding protein